MIKGVFSTLATLPQQPNISKTSVILVYGPVHTMDILRSQNENYDFGLIVSLLEHLHFLR